MERREAQERKREAVDETERWSHRRARCRQTVKTKEKQGLVANIPRPLMVQQFGCASRTRARGSVDEGRDRRRILHAGRKRERA